MFRLSDVSGRTVVSVWIIVAAYMGSLLVLSAAHNHEREAILNKQYAWLADITPSSHLTATQRAQRDSFVDSLKQFAARYGNLAKKSGHDVYAVGRGLPVAPVLMLGFGVLFGPALVAAGLTVLWFRSRRTKGREAGA